MRLLTFTTLFPNAVRPAHGIFVETRLRQLVGSGKVEVKVVAPVPWFPFRHSIFGSYASFARVPKYETRFGIHVEHPRYFLPPKISTSIAPELLVRGAKPCITRLIEAGFDFDLIDAHYFYPDGVAAIQLGKYFNKPVVITARGSDITLLPKLTVPRKKIIAAAKKAHGIITVCNALRDELINLGAQSEKIVSLRNGVDLDLFTPNSCGSRLPVPDEDGPVRLLTVGHLVPVKGHEIILRSLAMLPTTHLVIAGDGILRKSLERLALKLKVRDRVTFLGNIKQTELQQHYSAADIFVLASEREGWANVLLESMACGTPVVASNVWGTPEVVASPAAGLLMQERTPEALVMAIKTLLRNYPDRNETRRYAEQFSWRATSEGQLRLFEHILRV